MTGSGLTTGDAFLIEGAKNYFKTMYQNPNISISTQIDKNLNWVPTLSFKINSHLTVAAEVSEIPYPMILRIRRLDVQKTQIPISVYCICPEEAYLADQASAKALMNDGYGLVTIAADGTAQKRAGCIPLIQQIMDQEFFAEVKGLPKVLRIRLAESFERYKFSAPSGVTDITEIMEGLILKAGRDAAVKKWISNSDAKAGNPAKTLQAMGKAPQFNNCHAAIGAVTAFISVYRNSAHHFPKDNKQAHQKYRDCKHAYIEGLKKVSLFRDAMRSVGLTGGI